MGQKVNTERFAMSSFTAAQWIAANPVLMTGEEGLENDSKRKKIGDGITAWNDLPYESFLIGEIKDYAGSDLPAGWLLCDGSEKLIATYPFLNTILNGVFNLGSEALGNFRLPDLRGRTTIGTGQGTNLTNRDIGATGGSESVTVSTDQMPSHTHTGTVTPKAGTGKINLISDPINNYPGQTPSTNTIYTASNNAVMGSSPLSINNAGNGEAVNIMPPFLAIKKIIKY